jgi:hypothetical protein
MVKAILPLMLSISQIISGLACQPRPAHALLAENGTFRVAHMQNTDCGVPFQIELELVVRRFPPGVRRGFVLLEPELFTSENLKRVFLCLSRKYPQPEYLSIIARSDRASLQGRIDRFLADQAIRRDGSFEKDTNGPTDPSEELDHEIGQYRAYYNRSAIIEEFIFSPDPKKPDMLSEVIRRDWPYAPTSDKNADLVRASTEGLEGEVIRLLTNGAAVNGRNKFGNTALIAAILGGGAEDRQSLA